MAAARTATISCTDDFAGGKTKMQLRYDGDATGTLSVTAGVGSFTLPAHAMTSSDDPGSFIVISGSGTVGLKLPAFETLEACEAKQAFPSVIDEGIVKLYSADSCFSGLPPAASPVPVQVTISFVLDPGKPPTAVPDAEFSEMKLLYPQKSALFNSKMQLGTLVPPDCVFVR